MPDTDGAPFDRNAEVLSAVAGGPCCQLHLPYPPSLLLMCLVFMGQINIRHFQGHFADLAPSDRVIFLSSSPNIDENFRMSLKLSEFCRPPSHRKRIAVFLSSSLNWLIPRTATTVLSATLSTSECPGAAAHTHALSYGYLFPRPLVPTYDGDGGKVATQLHHHKHSSGQRRGGGQHHG